MKCFIYIDAVKIGGADLSVIDESMGVIGGEFIPSGAYNKFQSLIQDQCEHKGISNLSDFNYRIAIANHIDLNPEGGIGITDLRDFDEIYIECAGLNGDQLMEFK